MMFLLIELLRNVLDRQSGLLHSYFRIKILHVFLITYF